MCFLSNVWKVTLAMILKENAKKSPQTLELIFAFTLSIMLVVNIVSYTSTMAVMQVCVGVICMYLRMCSHLWRCEHEYVIMWGMFAYMGQLWYHRYNFFRSLCICTQVYNIDRSRLPNHETPRLVTPWLQLFCANAIQSYTLKCICLSKAYKNPSQLRLKATWESRPTSAESVHRRCVPGSNLQ